MAYRMEYGKLSAETQSGDPGKHHVWLFAFGFFCLFLLLTEIFWPEGREVIRMLLIPGDPDVTTEAAEVFASAVAQGISPKEAAATFCHTIFSS